MEHEVFVPVTPELLRQTLADPARVARCVPGLQQDADAAAGPLAGRLRVRVGGHTITYRGALRLTGAGGDTWTVEGEGTEARGTGGAKLSLTLRLAPAEDGATLGFTGTVAADGRLAEVPPDTAATAAHRLLARFAEALAEEAGRERPVPDDAEPEASALPEAREASDGRDEQAAPEAAADAAPPRSEASAGGDDTSGDACAAEADAPASASASGDEVSSDADTPHAAPASGDAPAPADASASDDGGSPGSPASSDDEVSSDDETPSDSVFDVPVPPSSLEPLIDDEFDAEPPAEAAHARRTMIGRSAEEVDHAPPRGRYAPVPPPEAARAGAALRWVAPAAALAIASAVVVGRALRRRR
ncbi:SRPBCC domain-containing protein [Streptomyces sp. HUAS MG47]|uniref:SRPBCC family protein n=1 Tax=Streptomyces solicamelliae TaxID=3231716 RepID=UPI0038780598